jgi:NAD(P)-dependent dehydrogenase (short-subunit alcohol dehydrogenase family)
MFDKRKPIDFDLVKTNGETTAALTLYAQSNVARTLFAYQLAKKYPNITSTSVHPGLVKSNIWNTLETLPRYMRWAMIPIVYFMGLTAKEGAKTQLWCSFSKDVENGAYYEPVGKRADGKVTRDEILAQKLWDWTEQELTKNGGPGWATT